MGLWDEADGEAVWKALYDKREALAKKDDARDVERVLKSRFRA